MSPDARDTRARYPDALIGYTGFVGSNLLESEHFDELYNSSNIASIESREFEKVVCAGSAAVKWWANANPEEDRRRIGTLIERLLTVSTNRFVLISTIDVYAEPIGVSERDLPRKEGLHAYGRNRLELEEFVEKHFSVYHIVRLPALFGPRLKKNAIFDLIHNHRLEFIPPDAEFQWYPVRRLARDLRRIEDLGLRVVNLATEPVSMRRIVEDFFPDRQIGAEAQTAGRYDMRSMYAEQLCGVGAYHITAKDVLHELGHYIRTERA